ncbi:leukocidin family pore-forming toxin [Bacillus cereus]|nr:leukocidin family pore-forming toxin [Bacillus cereus]
MTKETPSALRVNQLNGGHTTKPDVKNIGDGAQVFTDVNVDESSEVYMKTTLNVSFIEDPNSQKKFAVLTTEGSNIDSYGWDGGGKQRPSPVGNGYWRANMYWPSAYETNIKVLDTGAKDPKFTNIAPKNGVTDTKITSTVGYTTGGTISAGPAPAGGTGGVNWSKSVSYDQPDYKTEVTQNTSNSVTWRVPFVSMLNQGWGPYTRDSNTNNSIGGYKGNELFIKSGDANVSAKDNFISADQMTPLVGYGFSPAMIGTLAVDTHDDVPTTTIEVTHTRYVDDYEMHWADFLVFPHAHWFGINYQDKDTQTFTTKYQLDWKNHTITKLNSKANTQDNGYGEHTPFPDSYPHEH